MANTSDTRQESLLLAINSARTSTSSCHFRQLLPMSVVISGPFFLILLHNHFITIFFKKKCGEAKDSVIFPFFFCFIRELTLYSPLVLALTHPRELKHYTPPLPSPSTHLSAHTSHTTHSPIHRWQDLSKKFHYKQNVVTTKPTQVIYLLNVINAPTFRYFHSIIELIR